MTTRADPLRARGSDVAALSDALRRGGFALESVPQQLKELLESESWRHFVTRLGKEVEHERFADFVTTPPLAGLGASVGTIRKLVSDDPVALDLLDQAVQNPVGTNVPSNNVTTQPAGNSRDKALRKLRKDSPELHAEVLAGRLTAHAAMVRAGYRPPTFSVRADDAAAAARALRRHMPPDQLAELARLLTEG